MASGFSTRTRIDPKLFSPKRFSPPFLRAFCFFLLSCIFRHYLVGSFTKCFHSASVSYLSSSLTQTSKIRVIKRKIVDYFPYTVWFLCVLWNKLRWKVLQFVCDFLWIKSVLSISAIVNASKCKNTFFLEWMHEIELLILFYKKVMTKIYIC